MVELWASVLSVNEIKRDFDQDMRIPSRDLKRALLKREQLVSYQKYHRQSQRTRRDLIRTTYHRRCAPFMLRHFISFFGAALITVQLFISVTTSHIRRASFKFATKPPGSSASFIFFCARTFFLFIHCGKTCIRSSSEQTVTTAVNVPEMMPNVLQMYSFSCDGEKNESKVVVSLKGYLTPWSFPLC